MDKSIVRDIESGCKTKENDIDNKSIVVFCIFFVICLTALSNV